MLSARNQPRSCKTKVLQETVFSSWKYSDDVFPKTQASTDSREREGKRHCGILGGDWKIINLLEYILFQEYFHFE